ncbi:MAG: response regulator [Acidimicrobiales bacterium]
MTTAAATFHEMPRLIVEADPDLAQLMASQLAASGARVQVAGTLADALAATEHDLVVVVLDLDLPDSRGQTTFYEFSGERPDHPVLVVSDHPREPVGHELIRAGATEVVERARLRDQLLPLAVEVAVTRWERRRRLTDLTVDSGILTARLTSVRPLLEEAEARIARLAETLGDSPDPGLNKLASTVSDVRDTFQAAAPLDDAGFRHWLAALHALVDDDTGLRVTVECELGHLPPRLDRHVRAAVQELVANAMRHASANEVSVEVRQASRQIWVRVSDDGCGLGEDADAGNGMLNLQRRAARLGGGFQHHRSGGRTCLDWWIPTAEPR